MSALSERIELALSLVVKTGQLVKFSNFKTREGVLSARLKIRSSGTTVTEDFSQPTRVARKKLIDYGKRQGGLYHLKYKKLYINKKCYVFCYDSVREVVNELNNPHISSSPGSDTNVIAGNSNVFSDDAATSNRPSTSAS